jgi:hypothetical protein
VQLGVRKPQVNKRFSAQLLKYFAFEQAILYKLLKLLNIKTVGSFTPQNTSWAKLNLFK